MHIMAMCIGWLKGGDWISSGLVTSWWWWDHSGLFCRVFAAFEKLCAFQRAVLAFLLV